MTRISEIHGIPQDEYQDRGQMVGVGGYIPYLSLTKGEMELYLAAQRAKIFAQWYGPDAPQYGEAVTMIENALHSGISRGVHFVGAVPDYLQNVARLIQKASRQTAPASKGIFARQNLAGIGQIDISKRYYDCIKYAQAAEHKAEYQRRFRECQTKLKIEKILNGGIENSGHHMVYKSIPANFTIPSRVDIKRILHKTGVEGMAIVAKMDNQFMYSWVENGIIGKNAKAGVGPISSPITSFYLAPNADELIALIKSRGQDRPNAAIQGIGVLPAAVPIIVALIGAAASAAATILKALRSEEAYAMSEARGFSTDAWSGEKNDWTPGAGNPEANQTNNLLLLGAAAAALFLLTDDN